MVIKVRLTGIFLICAEELLDLIANLSVRNLNVILGSAILRHEGKEVVISDIQLWHCQWGIGIKGMQ